ncbi:ABC transporter substrate-binding protein [Pseudoroseicyclus aestuarii]|uniref:Carbohydrate ABC transporter substrate-binding protein (CUT1 family) n=1 Tax=Pseudoroseicyclus aestuarii TaxID=1795041 RepID=A0A318SUU0_9RHOB|nr:sugar ABC transporter substrate-binding protein [Pseudoroseicyclus aestuarii]PYE85680.1 carbohydrate ABC transporter substrate-binding protein (CUT1 family) [Pseudoroseicyclus aestuarii]
MKLRNTILASTALVGLAGAAAAQEEIYIINCGTDAEPQVPVQQEAIEAWEAENPDYTVNLEFVAWGQCQEKATTLASAGNPPAIALMGSRVLMQLADAGLIRPFDMTEEELSSYEDSVLQTVQFDGQVWGLPRAFSTKALYYNKALFEEAGLDPESPPETFEELVSASQAITENTDARGFGMVAASFDATMHDWLNFVYSNGGTILGPDGEVTFDTPEVIEALQLYADLVPYSEDGPIAYDRGKLEPLFREGQVAMYISGGWGRQRTGDVDYGLALIPHGPSGENGTLLITDSLVVFEGSGVEEAATDLALALTSTEAQSAFDIAGAWTPIRQTQDTDALIEEDPTWEPFITSIPTGGPEPLMLDYVAMQDAIIEAIQGVILGEVTAEEAAAEAQEQLEELAEE